MNKLTNQALDWWEQAVIPVKTVWQRINHEEKDKREVQKQQEQDELSKKRQQKLAQTALGQIAA